MAGTGIVWHDTVAVGSTRMADRSDAELLARFQRGDAQALERIFERYEQPLFLFLLGLLRDHHRAQDALQETFVKALERLDTVDPGHFRGWLFTVGYHQAMLARRKRAVHGRRLPSASPEESVTAVDHRHADPALAAAAREEADRCRALLAHLPAAQRDVIRRHLFDGQRFREIAADLGCPLNTALARMHQGLKRLRALGESEA
jgi:RNA polymerase sigma-70 factor (ECF subfamily)